MCLNIERESALCIYVWICVNKLRLDLATLQWHRCCAIFFIQFWTGGEKNNRKEFLGKKSGLTCKSGPKNTPLIPWSAGPPGQNRPWNGLNSYEPQFNVTQKGLTIGCPIVKWLFFHYPILYCYFYCHSHTVVAKAYYINVPYSQRITIQRIGNTSYLCEKRLLTDSVGERVELCS